MDGLAVTDRDPGSGAGDQPAGGRANGLGQQKARNGGPAGRIADDVTGRASLLSAAQAIRCGTGTLSSHSDHDGPTKRAPA